MDGSYVWAETGELAREIAATELKMRRRRTAHNPNFIFKEEPPRTKK
jgi:hypothetical protein